MKRWISWVKGDGYLASRNPLVILGRIIISIWISILAISALVMGGMFLTHPGDFNDPAPDKECITVEHNGEAIDTCEYLNQ